MGQTFSDVVESFQFLNKKRWIIYQETGNADADHLIRNIEEKMPKRVGLRKALIAVYVLLILVLVVTLIKIITEPRRFPSDWMTACFVLVIIFGLGHMSSNYLANQDMRRAARV